MCHIIQLILDNITIRLGVMMVDIQTISVAVASASVTLAAIYYIWQIGHQNKIRQTDLVIRISDFGTRKEFLEACMDIFETDFKDYDDFVRKYGSFFSKRPIPMSFFIVSNFMERIGVLLRNKLLDISMVSQLITVTDFWEKMKPIIEGVREEEHNQKYYEYFEYLYNEVKKRGARNG
jgi:hypothetical protein